MGLLDKLLGKNQRGSRGSRGSREARPAGRASSEKTRMIPVGGPAPPADPRHPQGAAAQPGQPQAPAPAHPPAQPAHPPTSAYQAPGPHGTAPPRPPIRPEARPPAPAPAAAAPHSSPPPPAAGGDPAKTIIHEWNAPKSGPVVAVLVAIEGEDQGRVFAISDGTTKLGRSPDCGALFHSQKVSRDHAEIRHSDGMFAIKPLSENNPTYLNDQPTEGDVLSDGDTIRLGRTTLKFRTV